MILYNLYHDGTSAILQTLLVVVCTCASWSVLDESHVVDSTSNSVSTSSAAYRHWKESTPSLANTCAISPTGERRLSSSQHDHLALLCTLPSQEELS